MISKESLSINYRSFNQEFTQAMSTKGSDSENNNGDNNRQLLVESTYNADYLEINLQRWKATSMTEEIINFISDYFSAQKTTGSQEELRGFYARAKEAIDSSFNQAISNSEKSSHGNNSNHHELLNSAHNQAVKELKDWYHNGGKPREKVDLTVIEVNSISIESEVSKIINHKAADI